jgi:hypothetical protein
MMLVAGLVQVVAAGGDDADRNFSMVPQTTGPLLALESQTSHAWATTSAHIHDALGATSESSAVTATQVEPADTSSAPPTTVPATTDAPTATATTLAPLAPTTSTPILSAAALTGDVTLSNPVVASRAILEFDSPTNTTLRVQGNLTVLGTLVMHPGPDVIHRIVFEDRGELLVTAGGVLDIQGTRKVAWNRTGADSTWKSSDELIAAPVAPGDWEHHPFNLGSAVPTYAGYAAEVANLTRNVVIDGPSRIMFMGLDGHAPQVIKYAAIVNAGVRDQVGMYALHFHLNGNATRGSVVEGVVIRDAHFRAFVPHGSNGITFRDTLAIDVVANGYWWDLNRASEPPSSINESHGIVYERAGVIGLTTSDPPDQGRQAGFNLGDGNGNIVRDSFVAGLRSGQNHSGFHWPEGAHGVWTAQNLVSHNNRGSGFFVWQNGAEVHVISRIDAYLNGEAGINQGAYKSSYRWMDVRLVGNGEGVRLHTFSQPAPSPRQSFECVTITDSPVGVKVEASAAPVPGDPTLFSNLVIQSVGVEIEVSPSSIASGQDLGKRVELVNYQNGC